MSSKHPPRDCVTCGRPFRGPRRECSPCVDSERACTECGRKFTGHQSKCITCQAVERSCLGCGKTFTSAGLRCFSCKSTERDCIDCGRSFTSNHRRCPGCRRKKRGCTSCGKEFTGTTLCCLKCRAKEHPCLDCGRTHTDANTRCSNCWQKTLPPDRLSAKRRTARNARRAREIAAEVAGPIPHRVYAAIAKSGPCVYCGKAATTVDHVRPLFRGGWEHESNLAPACSKCNYSKGPRLLTEWDLARVAHGIAHSLIVADEYARLLAVDEREEVA